MLNKETYVFITEIGKDYVAKVIDYKLGATNDSIGIQVPEIELTSRFRRYIIKKLIARNTFNGYRLVNYLQRNYSSRKFKLGINKGQDALNERCVTNLIYRYSPCAIITNSYTTIPGLVRILKKVGVGTQLFVCADEFTINKNFVNEDVSHYFVDNISVRNFLIENGVYAERIDVNPIPVTDRYFKPYSKESICDKLGFPKGLPVVLINATRVKDKNMKSLIDFAADNPMIATFVVAAGQNDSIFDYANSKNVKVFGPNGDQKELIGAADIVVTRPNTVLIKQSSAMKTPVVMIDPLGTRENMNAEFLVNNEKAYLANDLGELRTIIERLITGSLKPRFDTVDKYSAEKIATKMREIINSTK